jgi:hypothetical protein
VDRDKFPAGGKNYVDFTFDFPAGRKMPLGLVGAPLVGAHRGADSAPGVGRHEACSYVAVERLAPDSGKRTDTIVPNVQYSMFEERRSLDSRFTLLAFSTIGMTPSGETGKRGDCPRLPRLLCAMIRQ